MDFPIHAVDDGDDDAAHALPPGARRFEVGDQVESCWQCGHQLYPGVVKRVYEHAAKGGEGHGDADSARRLPRAYDVSYFDGGFETETPSKLVMAPKDVRFSTKREATVDARARTEG